MLITLIGLIILQWIPTLRHHSVHNTCIELCQLCAIKEKNRSQFLLPSLLRGAKLDLRKGDKNLFPFSINIDNPFFSNFSVPPHIYCTKHPLYTVITGLLAKEFTDLPHYSLVMPKRKKKSWTWSWLERNKYMGIISECVAHIGSDQCGRANL